jgi:hypothetical protein
VQFHSPGAPSAPWQRLSDLVDDIEALEQRVHAVRIALGSRSGKQPGDIERRVAASVTHLGLVARLIAPAIASNALGYLSISLATDGLWWQDQFGGPYPLSVVAARDRSSLITASFVEIITVATASHFGVSERVLWGNIGSAANSAARLVAATRPDVAVRATQAANAVLADHRVDGGTLQVGTDFKRLSCCLIYRISGTRLAACGDCILTRPYDTSGSATQAPATW